jgi:hypothetical protein
MPIKLLLHGYQPRDPKGSYPSIAQNLTIMHLEELQKSSD